MAYMRVIPDAPPVDYDCIMHLNFYGGFDSWWSITIIPSCWSFVGKLCSWNWLFFAVFDSWLEVLSVHENERFFRASQTCCSSGLHEAIISHTERFMREEDFYKCTYADHTCQKGADSFWVKHKTGWLEKIKTDVKGCLNKYNN